jgi:hypothetical protein
METLTSIPEEIAAMVDQWILDDQKREQLRTGDYGQFSDIPGISLYIIACLQTYDWAFND